MKIVKFAFSCALAACALHATTGAAPVSVDGILGAEWAAVTPVSVTYNPAAPVSNFGTPTSESNNVSYNIFARGDANYLYIGLVTTGNPSSYVGGLDFANLYFSTNLTGSNMGFEVLNQLAFVPGVPGSVAYTPGSHDIHFAVTNTTALNPGVIEFAAAWPVFTANTLGLVPAPAIPLTAVQLRLSQSFGYSVAGGASYGATRLGQVNVPGAVPEPSTIALLGLAAASAVAVRRKMIA